MEFPHFQLEMHLQSGSIFQPAMLVYQSVGHLECNHFGSFPTFSPQNVSTKIMSCFQDYTMTFSPLLIRLITIKGKSFKFTYRFVLFDNPKMGNLMIPGVCVHDFFATVDKGRVVAGLVTDGVFQLQTI